MDLRYYTLLCPSVLPSVCLPSQFCSRLKHIHVETCSIKKNIHTHTNSCTANSLESGLEGFERCHNETAIKQFEEISAALKRQDCVKSLCTKNRTGVLPDVFRHPRARDTTLTPSPREWACVHLSLSGINPAGCCECSHASLFFNHECSMNRVTPCGGSWVALHLRRSSSITELNKQQCRRFGDNEGSRRKYIIGQNILKGVSHRVVKSKVYTGIQSVITYMKHTFSACLLQNKASYLLLH